MRILILLGTILAFVGSACQPANNTPKAKETPSKSPYLAKVFAIDPVATPEPITVELQWLNSSKLTSVEDEQGIQKISVVSCLDEGETAPGDLGMQKICTLRQLADSEANDSFIYSDWEKGAAGRYDDQDIHAEVSAYYHTQKLYQMITAPEVGLLQHLPNEHSVGSQKLPLTVIVNYRDPVPADQPSLLPHEGAFMFPSSYPPIMKDIYGVPGLEGPIIFLGQGRNIDAAYAGDIVYHEFGHLINGAMAPTFPYYIADTYGVSYLPRALNEGLANTWAFVGSNSSELSVYWNFHLTGRSRGMFSGENQDVYPQTFTGWHPVADGNAVLGANWQAYRWLVENANFSQSDFVRLLLTALTQLNTTPGVFDFVHYNNAFLNALEELGYVEHRAAIASIFEDKGLANPERAINIQNFVGDYNHNMGIGSTTDWNPQNVVLEIDRDGSTRRASTAFAQMYLTLTGDNTSVTLRGELRPSYMPWSQQGDFDLELLLRHNQVIEFPENQAQAEFDRKVLPQLEQQGMSQYVTWQIDQLNPGETYYFHIVNYGLADGEISALQVTQSL